MPSDILPLDSCALFSSCSAAPECTCRCQHASPEPLGTEGPGQSGQRWHEKAGRLAAVPVGCGSPEGLPWTQWKHGGGGASEELPVQPGPGRPAHRRVLPPARPPAAAAAAGLLTVCIDSPRAESYCHIRLIRGNLLL